MIDELDLIRVFRAEDGVVDAASRDEARAALLEHLGSKDLGKRNAQRRGLGRHAFGVRISGEVVAVLVTTLVVLAVGAALLSVGGSRRPLTPSGHAAAGQNGPPVIHNFGARTMPPLPGQMVCNADLGRPGSIPGLGGSPSGVFQANANEVRGVNKFPFSITASGLHPNTGEGVYAAWLLPAVQTTTGGYRLIRPLRPRLLGVIKPAVSLNGKLAAQGVAGSDLSGTYLFRLTLQPHASARTPGRTVLQGFISL